MRHLSPEDVFTHAIREMAGALSERPGEAKEQHSARFQVATEMILSLAPRDLPEAMLAGHGIMFHALMTDSIRRAFQDETETTRQNARRGNLGMIVALSRSFLRSLGKLEAYQSRPGEKGAEPGVSTPEAETAAATGEVIDDPAPIKSEAPSPDQTSTAEARRDPDQTRAGRGTVVSAARHDAARPGNASGDDPPAIPTNVFTGAQAATAETRAPHLNRAQRRRVMHGGWRDNATPP